MPVIDALTAAGIRLRHTRPGEHRAPCPRCNRGPRDDALAVKIDDHGATWTCHRCGWTSGARGDAHRPAPRPAPSPDPTPDQRTGWAIKLWQQARPAAGTLVEHYLGSRGLTGPIPPTLRFLERAKHSRTKTQHPAMLAAVFNVRGELVAVHRTYLKPDGSGKAVVEPAKAALGPVRGAAIWLHDDGPLPPGRLVVAEGIETALSVQLATGIPAWAGISAGGIKALELPPLPHASEVIIAADHDPPGRKAAAVAARRWHAEGRLIRIAVPPEPGDDFNDLLRRGPA